MTLNGTSHENTIRVANMFLENNVWESFEIVHKALKESYHCERTLGDADIAKELDAEIGKLTRKYWDAVTSSDASNWVEADGGRADAGHKGLAGDCITRAISIALDLPYQEVWNEFDTEGDSPDDGVQLLVASKFLYDRGWKSTPKSGTVAEVAAEIKNGMIICELLDTAHYVAIVDGKYHDTWNSGAIQARAAWAAPADK